MGSSGEETGVEEGDEDREVMGGDKVSREFGRGREAARRLLPVDQTPTFEGAARRHHQLQHFVAYPTAKLMSTPTGRDEGTPYSVIFL